MILDTNALSALAQRDQALMEKIWRAPRLAITLISLGEYHYGIRRSRHAKELLTWLEALLDKVELLTPTMETLPHYAGIRLELKEAGTPIPANDCWIAALVRQYQMPLLSLDRHFDHVSQIERLDW